MHILVTAASRHGSTVEIATAIADRLARRGIHTTVAAPDEVGDISGYDAVILGSAVYAGHWLRPATELAERLQTQLRSRPVWLFSSGPVGDPPKPDEDAVEVAGLLAATGARGHQVFAGKIDRKKLGFSERALVRALKAPVGDFRDWGSVDEWADQVALELGAVAL